MSMTENVLKHLNEKHQAFADVINALPVEDLVEIHRRAHVEYQNDHEHTDDDF